MSEFQPINIADGEEEIIIIKKTKKVKSTLKGLTKKVELIIEDEEKSVFINQVFRKDILANMLANTKLTGKELFDMIMKENKELYDERRQGWIFETLCQILIILKCIENINYTEIYDGQLQNLKQIKNINTWFIRILSIIKTLLPDFEFIEKEQYTLLEINHNIHFMNKYTSKNILQVIKRMSENLNIKQLNLPDKSSALTWGF